MITLKVDEAYAFDYLSILEVKKENLSKQKEADQSYLDCLGHLESQVGQSKLSLILSSPEYQSLKFSNGRVFDGVEKARYGNISARDLDILNMDRFLKKKDIQQKFFKEELTELKS